MTIPDIVFIICMFSAALFFAWILRAYPPEGIGDPRIPQSFDRHPYRFLIDQTKTKPIRAYVSEREVRFVFDSLTSRDAFLYEWAGPIAEPKKDKP